MNTRRSRLVTLVASPALLLSVAGCGSPVDISLPSGATATSTTSPATSTSSTSAPSSPTSDATSTSSDATTSAGTSTSSSAASTPSAEDVVRQLTTNFNSAKSAHLHATSTKGDETRVLDISGTIDGSNQRTVLTIDKDNVKAEIRTVKARVYVNGNEGYYRYSGVSSARAKQVAGRWLSIPASTAASTTKDFTLASIFASLKSNISGSEARGLTVTASTRDGQNVWQASNAQTTVVVAADGSGHLLYAANNGLLSDQSYTVDQWNAAPTVEAPSNPITT